MALGWCTVMSSRPTFWWIRDRPPDHVYLSDFGLSKEVDSAGLTGSGRFLGSPGYTAPEQMEGHRVDGRADQYLAGVHEFELLSGTPVFPRDQITAVIWAHMSMPPPPLTSRQPGLPAAVDAVLAKALARLPGPLRNCREFADALRVALGWLPTVQNQVSRFRSPGGRRPGRLARDRMVSSSSDGTTLDSGRSVDRIQHVRRRKALPVPGETRSPAARAAGARCASRRRGQRN